MDTGEPATHVVGDQLATQERDRDPDDEYAVDRPAKEVNVGA